MLGQARFLPPILGCPLHSVSELLLVPSAEAATELCLFRCQRQVLWQMLSCCVGVLVIAWPQWSWWASGSLLLSQAILPEEGAP